jgi:hypothetical protein
MLVTGNALEGVVQVQLQSQPKCAPLAIAAAMGEQGQVLRFHQLWMQQMQIGSKAPADLLCQCCGV